MGKVEKITFSHALAARPGLELRLLFSHLTGGEGKKKKKQQNRVGLMRLLETFLDAGERPFVRRWWEILPGEGGERRRRPKSACMLPKAMRREEVRLWSPDVTAELPVEGDEPLSSHRGVCLRKRAWVTPGLVNPMREGCLTHRCYVCGATRSRRESVSA